MQNALLSSDEPIWRRANAALHAEARRVKEALSLTPRVDVLLALPSGLVQTGLARDELHGLLDPYLRVSTDALADLISDTGIDRADLGGTCSAGLPHAPVATGRGNDWRRADRAAS